VRNGPCSETHKKRISEALKRAWKSGKRKPKKQVLVGKICKNCGNIFFVKAKQKEATCCSRFCYLDRKRRTSKGKGNPFYGKKHTPEVIKKLKDKTVKHTKESCLKMSLSRKGKKFTLEHRKNLSKAHYKGSPYRCWKEKIRKSHVYKIWRESVFERDNYTCQKCFKRNGEGKYIYLEAHHIKSFKNHPDLRFEISNGLTLCKDCHNIISKKQMFGNKNGLGKTKKAA